MDVSIDFWLFVLHMVIRFYFRCVCMYSSRISAGTRLPPVAQGICTAFAILSFRPIFSIYACILGDFS